MGGYVNFESAHVHPLTLTPDGARLLAVNTPDAILEVFAVQTGGDLVHEAAIPVGLEPVSVRARDNNEVWVVNHLSDTVSVVDLGARHVVRTLHAGDEPSDVVFAGSRAFVSVAQEDALRVFDLNNLDLAPVDVPLDGRKPRALAVSTGGTQVYAVALFSGNQTTIVNGNSIFGTGLALDGGRLSQLGLNDITCDGNPPSYPPLPAGITRNPALTDPSSGVPEVGLIVRWNESAGRWEDDAGQDWNSCLPYRVSDHDLFVIDATSLAVTEVDHLGTTLFDVSVNPGNGKVYVSNTDARNFVRFEHPFGVQGHIVENRLSIVDPANAFDVTLVDLNTHIDRGSNAATNLAERQASVSQPGMMTWNVAGNVAYLAAIGSRKIFKVDGACTTGSCIFGPDRASPNAVETGGGPTGLALHEGKNRLYVLNRFSNSIAFVDTTSLAKVDEVPLHDPSSPTVTEGRRFLYDAIDGSGHGDAACSSCHIFGDRDDLAWDLGDPEGEFVPYSTSGDNVRFIFPVGGAPADCDPSLCAAHDGFDPQKGPMTTQTLKGMLEPLHWRGDRATMNDFNAAFVGLMGTADIGPINGKPAGLSADDMERFRQFALDMRFHPNPHRNVDDTLPDAPVPVRGSPFSGNPTDGLDLFENGNTDAGQACSSCHTRPFGAAGGKLGGVPPQDPTSGDAAALFFGDADGSQHSDLKVPHMRNMYEKIGPVFGEHGQTPPVVRSGFGFTHDGAIPDLGTFFSASVFTLTAQDVRDISSFTMHFPTGTKPAVGQHLTVPAGTPPTGAASDEALLGTLIGLGDLADSGRHCELVAGAEMGGRVRTFHLSGDAWVGDLAAEPPLTTTQLREGAAGPISFLCATLDGGTRLGGDRDEDSVLNGDDCADDDPASWGAPQTIADLTVERDGATQITWTEQGSMIGPGVRYDVASGVLSVLRSSGLGTASSCLAADLDVATLTDPNPEPVPGDGLYYLVRARNACDPGDWGQGREELDALACP
jgi:YVTN family beta-propeller protein